MDYSVSHSGAVTLDLCSGVAGLAPTLGALRHLACNLRWSWMPDVRELFRTVDPEQWDASNHNPVHVLNCINADRLDALAGDDSFVTHLNACARDLEDYLRSESTWFHIRFPTANAALIAYFSAEFGISECLPIFSGGLGVLAGDHLKSASDLGVPLVGVGLLYRQGYFQQLIDDDGRQDARYDDSRFEDLPLTLERQTDGMPLTVEVPFPGRVVRVQVWRVQVGRVALYLLDSDVPENDLADRLITGRLYGGDNETRIQQELVLGMGGCRALDALGLVPTVYHMNEGHAAFLALERIRAVMTSQHLAFNAALAVVRGGTVFTTHTPVPAGHDYFPPDLVDHYLGHLSRDLGLSRDELLALGRRDPQDTSEYFCMTVLALKLARCSNGVSKLHADVSNDMWRNLLDGSAPDVAPIDHVTNGVHVATWVGQEQARFYTNYLGADWPQRVADPALWARIHDVPGAVLWRLRQEARARLVAYIAGQLERQAARRGVPDHLSGIASNQLDVRALTIGFARRFATYKRATLLLRDPERLARLVNAPGRPVQFIFAGKAHPKDEGGKELIERLVRLSQREEFAGRLIFLENYDTAMARQLVRGVDVWLNTPQRPYEASGTSGMKAMFNGVLNCSTLDGWWAEAWSDQQAPGGPFGWALGTTREYPDAERQAAADADALYATLEQDIIPTFYDRDGAGFPARWVAMMKASLAALAPYFNTDRMVRQYTEQCYLPAGSPHGDGD